MKWPIAFGIAVVLAVVVSRAEEAAAPAAGPTPEELIAKLDGFVKPRPTEGWVQIKMEGVSLTVRFYDKEAKPIAPDVDRATARFNFPGREDQRRILVRSSAGDFLTHGQPIRPPHVFKLILSFFRGDSNEAVETYTIEYS